VPETTTRTLDLNDVTSIIARQIDKKGESYTYEEPIMVRPWEDWEIEDFAADGVTDLDPMCEQKLGCVYFEDTATPSCIVGHLAFDLGFDLDDVEPWNEDTGVQSLIDCLFEPRGFKFTEAAALFLEKIQYHQDRGLSWGNAYDWALESVLDNLGDDAL
jgi:hypothetical protein